MYLKIWVLNTIFSIQIQNKPNLKIRKLGQIKSASNLNPIIRPEY